MCGVIYTKKARLQSNISSMTPSLGQIEKMYKDTHCHFLVIPSEDGDWSNFLLSLCFVCLFLLLAWALRSSLSSKCSGFGWSPDSMTIVNALMKCLPLNICVTLYRNMNSMTSSLWSWKKLYLPSKFHSLILVSVFLPLLPLCCPDLHHWCNPKWHYRDIPHHLAHLILVGLCGRWAFMHVYSGATDLRTLCLQHDISHWPLILPFLK